MAGRHWLAFSAMSVIYDIPRSGAEYPRAFRSVASLTDLQQSVSAFVEELYAGVTGSGAIWLYAWSPNAYLDTNRYELDIDPAVLAGVWPMPLQPSSRAPRA